MCDVMMSTIVQKEVWLFMELMSTSLDKLLKKLNGPVPEDIVCIMAVSVSQYRGPTELCMEHVRI